MHAAARGAPMKKKGIRFASLHATVCTVVLLNTSTAAFPQSISATQNARRLLRSLLPAEYGLATGFIVFQDEQGNVRLSKQLDIIVYDAVHSAPLMSLEACDVLPLEAVYAYVGSKGIIN